MKIPEPEITVEKLIDAYHENLPDNPRPHMGCSILGQECERAIWLSFRWVVQKKFSGRMRRLFRRGQNEEEIIARDLRAAGLDVRKTGKDQIKVNFGCHVSGSIDGIIESGVPEAPKKRHVLECKTHNLKSFTLLKKDGVEKSKPQHFVQMQLYMHGTAIDRALYVAVCKDNDEIYTERVRYDKKLSEKYIALGKRLALENYLPPPISTDPTWFQCKMCDYHEFCHETKMTKQVNCRTCAHSTSQDDGTWRCERYDAENIPVEFQKEGCESHVLHPDLVPWERKENHDDWTATYIINGKPVANGEADANVYSSKEIIANPRACSDGEEYLNTLRVEFGARIIDGEKLND